ncbi:NADH dehydrogenase (quinone) subunit G [Pseudoxanthomonas winnipegensis]|uniref:NADH-quinone oxidoreductase n=1 Tax=Pseudoxanthomonas winnipegensis TaxID=2480810 RepID=A0ABY1WCA7_9GAMM|nr:NADH-quinone oxidoreductase subunit NuoG [Pseudoxanthomonas winnipegensis]TAA11214.1 NADH dehydrogenase (quinone) subunit G [Pseudoxanthomonas winnipegensis]TAA18638.1 NADH dehydrogenase (quinone) subunit G [Pseudoxanthomonas winnipegensis]TAH73986.1 NADH dehydrogenase (quinone) subunit G [Pseudoxanthomonas winnipegensis]
MSAQPVDPNVPPDHVTIEIDGRVLYAPKGSMIIQAADKAGIPIPRFCYHDKLSIAANCRMCLVDTEVGGRPAPKPSPACATPVGDGLKVFTRNEKALKYQRSVMEFLLINHPLDCPICDQGGECELQDVSLGYGRSVSRFNERKRVVPDEDIGPLVATEMTRCIQCTRCVRFTAEVAGTYELGGMYRGENLQIGTYDGKPLTTELSGNVVDVCPVGALTNKVFQFRARPWELQARESLGFHDAMGSNLYVHVRRGEVLRTVPRDNEAVNECWLSDRDRYSHQGLYAADRAVKPLQKVDGEWKEVSWAEGLAAAAEILKAHAGDELGVLVHPATSNEEGGLVARLAAGLGSGNLDHRILANDLSDAAVAQPFGLPLAQIEKAGAIVVFGSNVRHELPLLHQRIRKAVRNGAKVHLVNPVDFDFTFSAASKAIVPPSQLADALGASALREAVQGASSAVVIVGALAENHPQAAALRKAAADFAAATGAALCRIPQGANAVGLARAGVLPGARDAADMVAQPRAAYVIYGIEPGLDFAHGFATQKALTAAKVVAFSHFACASTRRMADVILPIGALPEIEATLTNLDGIEQRTQAGGKLPGEAREGWKVLRALGGVLGLPGFDFTDLAGARASLANPAAVTPKASAAPSLAGEGLEVVATCGIYRTDGFVRRAQALQAHPLNTAPGVSLHPQDAQALGLGEGQVAKVQAADGTATLPVAINDRVAPGSAWIESGHGATAPIGAGRVKVVAA